MHVFGVLKIFTQGALFKTVNVDSLLVERVAISDNGVVLVENGIEKFMPEQVILFFGNFNFTLISGRQCKAYHQWRKCPQASQLAGRARSNGEMMRCMRFRISETRTHGRLRFFNSFRIIDNFREITLVACFISYLTSLVNFTLSYGFDYQIKVNQKMNYSYLLRLQNESHYTNLATIIYSNYFFNYTPTLCLVMNLSIVS